MDCLLQWQTAASKKLHVLNPADKLPGFQKRACSCSTALPAMAFEAISPFRKTAPGTRLSLWSLFLEHDLSSFPLSGITSLFWGKNPERKWESFHGSFSATLLTFWHGRIVSARRGKPGFSNYSSWLENTHRGINAEQIINLYEIMAKSLSKIK